MTTWRPEDRLKLLSELLDELAHRPSDVVLLVEGQRDRGGLRLLGVEGDVILVQQSGGILKVAEELAKNHKKAIILTDWDRKGGQLNRLLREALEANAVPYDDKTRRRLAKIVSGEIKDVESLPWYFSRLVSNVGIPHGEGYQG
ncbi:MAG: hypothetical protein A4E32_00297 [Methanomassiliicoccales archaeon PtaU1.Bin124]|nr:MAG: hypothetical protein A4E32_00297 [Methanomassiliicoccales archaeon PtaU1.Bin124]